MRMEVYQLMEFVSFALTVFIAGYSLSARK